MNATEACRNCRFSKTNGRVLDCRRYPPIRTSPVVSQHPAVNPDDWCGEWMRMRAGAGLPVEIAPAPTRPTAAVSGRVA